MLLGADRVQRHSQSELDEVREFGKWNKEEKPYVFKGKKSGERYARKMSFFAVFSQYFKTFV
jgi:hypothetical protein